MQSYTSQADDLYQEAIEVELDQGFYTSFGFCSQPQMQQQMLSNEANQMEDKARRIRRRFREIALNGVTLARPTMLRKGIISVKNGKSLFSINQLTQAVDSFMGASPHILFRPPSNAKNYLVLLFWATDTEDENCLLQQKVDLVKREIAVDGFELRFVVERVVLQQIYYLVNNYECLKIRNDEGLQLSPESQKELTSFQQMIDKSKLYRKSIEFE